ncbi:MAG: hypothetical protein WDZ77_02905 [Candidatus Pacearchaeota archaeon]
MKATLYTRLDTTFKRRYDNMSNYVYFPEEDILVEHRRVKSYRIIPREGASLELYEEARFMEESFIFPQKRGAVFFNLNKVRSENPALKKTLLELKKAFNQSNS